LFTFYLNDRTKGIMGDFWGPDECRASELTLTVEGVAPSAVRLRLRAFARLADDPDAARALRKAEFTFEGQLNYDPRKGAFDRFDVVALGENSDDRPIAKDAHYQHYFAKSGHVVLGGAFELAAPG